MTVELGFSMPTRARLSIHLPTTESAMAEGLAFQHANTVDLSVYLPATESPMAEGLALRHASNDRSQCALTIYRKSNGGGVSLSTCQQRYISVCAYPLQKVQWRRG